MKRDMSYDLDGAMSTRNQGQLIAQQRIQTQAMRTPGLQKISPPGPSTALPHTTAQAAQGPAITPVHDTKGVHPVQLGQMSLTLPGIGTIDGKSLLIGAGLVFLWTTLRNRRGRARREVGAQLLAS